MGHGHTEIRNPGPVAISGALRSLFIGFIVVGIASFVIAIQSGGDSQTRAWVGFAHSHFYFMNLALGGLFFAALQWLTGAMWSAPIRRIAESFTAYLPVVFVSFIVLAAGGMHTLYHWSHADVMAADQALSAKSGYLNSTFFWIRNLIAIAIWVAFAKVLIGNSIKQDTSKDYALTLKNRSLAPLFMILFGVSFTMVAFDQLMSLDPHWFSTMFGVYTFAGMLYSTLALICIITILLKRKGVLLGIVNENHLHDIGKFMFAFTIFWAYIAFSQYMLIWYANVPEETGYFLHRNQGPWYALSSFLLFGKFALPFFVLMKRAAKRCEAVLLSVAVFMMVAQWLDFLWIIQPEFFAGPTVGWIEIGIFMGFLGLFGTAVVRFLSKNNAVAIGDPRLIESITHHHQ